MTKLPNLLLAALLIAGPVTLSANTLQQSQPAPKKPKTDTTKTPKAAVQYTCPMHPEVLSAKPGKCDKCGMNLVKKEAGKKPSGKM